MIFWCVLLNLAYADKYGYAVGHQYDDVYYQQPVELGFVVFFNGAGDDQDKEGNENYRREYDFPFVMKPKIDVLKFVLVAIKKGYCGYQQQDKKGADNYFGY
jgi:hypothetical protein